MVYLVATTRKALKGGLLRAVRGRIELHVSQSEAARQWGVPQSTINAIVNGKDRCSVDYLLDLLMRDGQTIRMEIID